MTTRPEMLLAQALATATKRTRERDQLRAAMPTGLAVELLLAQIRRLRRTPCETMGFDPTEGHTTASARRELDELDAEEVGSEAWVAEWLDTLSCVLHMGVGAGLRIDEVVAGQAAKLGRRLDHIDAGGTWKGAKQKERGEPCTHPRPIDDGGCADGCCDDWRCGDCGKRWRVEYDG